MHELKWRAGSTLKPFKFMEAKVSRHKRCNSDPGQRKGRKHDLTNIFEVSHHPKLKMGRLEDYGEDKERQPPNIEVKNSLKQEISELQDQLQDQYMVRTALEKALSHRLFSHDIVTNKTLPKPAKDLIKEIAVLEMEVLYLEKYLLSVYRKIFDKEVLKLQKIDEQPMLNSSIQEQIFPVAPDHEIVLEQDNSAIQTSHVTSVKIGNLQENCKCACGLEELIDSGIHQCHCSTSQRWTGNSPQMRSLVVAADSYHSLPLSVLEQAENTTPNIFSLVDHLGTCTKDNAQETPNCLSEEMIRSISAIYCELADPPLINPIYPSSPISFSSSSNEFPSQGQGGMWSPRYGNFSSFNSSLDDPFHIRESKEFSGPYRTMAKVLRICTDSQKLKDAEYKLQTFRSLVSRLEEVDPRKLKHEEKLAFWINVHNALVMHAFLVYGIPRNNTKKVCLILKAAYNVGGHIINVDMIQNNILGCQLPRPGQWLRLLFSSRKKSKDGDARAAFSIEKPEPRLYFALCSGCYSDPAVRVFNPKTVFENLEAAKEEHIQSTLIVHKEKKLLLPKIVESFAKDLDLCPAGLVEMVEHLLPESLRKTIQHCQYRKFGKRIEWIPHNYTFGFLLSRELAQ